MNTYANPYPGISTSYHITSFGSKELKILNSQPAMQRDGAVIADIVCINSNSHLREGYVYTIRYEFDGMAMSINNTEFIKE